MKGTLLFTVTVGEPSATSDARRLARSTALEAGFSEEDAGRAAIIATEASSNLVKHAQGGELLVRVTRPPQGPIIDIIAVDRGPGMENAAACLRDGFTTTGTAGNGLGAIVRQSTFFDIFSAVGRGTVVLARIGAPGRPDDRASGSLLVDGLSLRKKGQEVSGDSWAAMWTGGRTSVLVADGLGHGESAADAANEAIDAFRRSVSTAPLDVLDRVHRALAKTRGAAVAVATVDAARGVLTYGGIGNISAAVENGAAARHLVSLHGTAGHQVRRLQDFTYPWSDGNLLIMHSDGVSAHWSLDAYPGLSARHPLLIAAVLLRDYSRGRDDATVVVAK